VDDVLFSDEIDKKQKEALQKRQANLDKWRASFKDTFSTPQGRKVLWYLMHESGFLSTTNQYNASIYAREGKREMGKAITDILGTEFVLESLIKVKQENTDER
jgi:hypothetical protein